MENDSMEVLNDETGEVVELQPVRMKQTTPKINFVIPENVDGTTLTLENYRDLTNKRFRMNPSQKNRGLSREEAFEESKALALTAMKGGE